MLDSQGNKKLSVSSIGMIGLGVMGRNLALNLRDHGAAVVGYDLSPDNRSRFDAEMGAPAACATLAELASRLPAPRRIMLLVPAGKPVDDVIASLRDHLAPGDILIDGGNSHYKDTQRRYGSLASEDILFIGMGVSGGEEGARTGPAMMAGGASEAWP
ncbi:MAG: NAD(P)-binding domain-containing protein, partial [Candidatus Hydrogenedentota bacterium]